MQSDFYAKSPSWLLIHFILIAILSIALSAVALLLLSATDLSEISPINDLRIKQLISSVFTFGVPPLAFWYLYGGGEVRRGLKVYNPLWRVMFYTLILVFASQALMQYMVQSSRVLSEMVFSADFNQIIKTLQLTRENNLNILIGDRTWVNFPMALVLMAVVPALVEEMFFRGTLQRISLRMTGNYHVAIFAVSLVFTAIHFDYYNFFGIFTASLILGYLYHFTGNILVVILFHFVSNMWNLTIMFLDTSIEGQLSYVDSLVTPWWWAALSGVMVFGIFKIIRHITFFEHRNNN